MQVVLSVLPGEVAASARALSGLCVPCLRRHADAMTTLDEEIAAIKAAKKRDRAARRCREEEICARETRVLALKTAQLR